MRGRQGKIGLDYFCLDCHTDTKLEMIEAEYGLKGFAVIIKLYQQIFSEFGYYCEWTPDTSVLWARRLSVSHGGDFGRVGSASKAGSLPGFPDNLINDIVAASIRRDIFSAELFHKYHILTSQKIQEAYLNATSRREKVEVKKEYLLVSVGKNRKNVVINSINVCRKSINVYENSQSRVAKSKEDKNIMCKADALALFEQLWKLYPEKKGKGQVSETQKKRLLKIGFDEMSRAIERYKAELKRDKWRKPQNGSTFFNSGYVDYLDANYVPGSQKQPAGCKNDFNNFQQAEYDFDALEQQLLSQQ